MVEAKKVNCDVVLKMLLVLSVSAKALRMILDQFHHERNHLQTISNELKNGLAKISGIVMNTPDKNVLHILLISQYLLSKQRYLFMRLRKKKYMFPQHLHVLLNKKK